MLSVRFEPSATIYDVIRDEYTSAKRLFEGLRFVQ